MMVIGDTVKVAVKHNYNGVTFNVDDEGILLTVPSTSYSSVRFHKGLSGEYMCNTEHLRVVSGTGRPGDGPHQA